MEALVTRCVVLNVTVATAKICAELRLALRQKGKPIPEHDLWIAALCVEHQAPLAAIDSHFDAIDALKRWDPLLRPSRGVDGRWTVDAWAPLEGRAINAGVRVGF